MRRLTATPGRWRQLAAKIDLDPRTIDAEAILGRIDDLQARRTDEDRLYAEFASYTGDGPRVRVVTTPASPSREELRKLVDEGRRARARIDEIDAAEDRMYEQLCLHFGDQPRARSEAPASREERAYRELSARIGTR